MELKIKKLTSSAVLPEFKTSGAACFDLVIDQIIVFRNMVTVGYGFASEIPQGYCVTITPRSSFCQKGWIMQNSPAIIDSDYRGEWMTKFEAIPLEVHTYTISSGDSLQMTELMYPDFPYKLGDRVTQGKLELLVPTIIKEVNELSDTERGTGACGSTN